MVKLTKRELSHVSPSRAGSLMSKKGSMSIQVADESHEIYSTKDSIHMAMFDGKTSPIFPSSSRLRSAIERDMAEMRTGATKKDPKGLTFVGEDDNESQADRDHQFKTLTQLNT